MKGSVFMYEYGYPCYPYYPAYNNNGYGFSWLWVIVIIFIAFCLFRGFGNNDCNHNGCNRN